MGQDWKQLKANRGHLQKGRPDQPQKKKPNPGVDEVKKKKTSTRGGVLRIDEKGEGGQGVSDQSLCQDEERQRGGKKATT